MPSATDVAGAIKLGIAGGDVDVVSVTVVAAAAVAGVETVADAD